jgi:hypothetical protein
MRLFNQALLACQAWRLIQYPNTLSLYVQLLKVVYDNGTEPRPAVRLELGICTHAVHGRQGSVVRGRTHE